MALRQHIQRRLFSIIRNTRSNDFTHCVIGGGVVGLAIARKLAQTLGTGTVLLERHNAVGTETSSRNSEVIHSGLYYPVNSLKTRLCIEGNRMMYAYCEKHHVPAKNTGKWIVAQTPDQLEALKGVYEHAKAHGVPMNWLSAAETQSREPYVRSQAGALESPWTGIVDSHSLMQSLLGDLEEAGGDVALETAVKSIIPLGDGEKGYKVSTSSGEVTADIVINAAGLGAIDISNSILPESRNMKPYFCKGTYFSYSKKYPVSTLIYPAPIKGLGGLGTHLTLDISGRLKFGPDVEWVEDPTDLTPDKTRMTAAIAAIQMYLPDIDVGSLEVDYCGIRPKIKPPGEGGVGQVDFIIREEDGFPGFINLLGIESPGLTSSLAIAKHVNSMLYK